MAPDHPERVAAWLGEVLGGPRSYSERFGGYDRMVSRHIGKTLREEQRARWVHLLCKSADDAGLPTDPEWRAAFVAYLEWGSRIAVENSQPGADPPPHMPVPRWSWVCDATPGSRVSALAEQIAQQERRPPRTDEPVSFAQHIKPLFRDVDRRSMRFAFDLWSHEEVATHARGDPRSRAGGDDAVRRSVAEGSSRGLRTLARFGKGCMNRAKREAVSGEPTIHRFPAKHEARDLAPSP